MTRDVILLVEDNPDLRHILHDIVSPAGFVCEDAENEHLAIERVSPQTLAVVTDINLSETGGGERGGIELAEQLAAQCETPLILISQTPWHHFPPTDKGEHDRWMKTHHVRAVLDRTEEDFADKLLKELRDAREACGRFQ